MKLQDLDAQRQTERVAKVFESHHGQRIDFGAIDRDKARNILKRVRGMIREHRSAPSFHFSERNPDYMKLVMMEQALVARLDEQDPATVQQQAMQRQQQQQQAMRAAQIQQKRKEIQDAIRQKQKEISDLQRMNAQVGIQESREHLAESELQQAQVVMAAQDMVDRLQGMLEDVSEMQFKDLPALTDSIRNDMGVDQATQFQADAAAALTNLLQALQAGKTQMEAAQGVLTGQAPVVPGEAELGAEPAVDASLDLDVDAELPAGGEEDEEETELVGLGRERR